MKRRFFDQIDSQAHLDSARIRNKTYMHDVIYVKLHSSKNHKVVNVVVIGSRLD